MVETIYSYLVMAPGPRPPFASVAERLWGRGCDFDSDGNSATLDARDWTELTLSLRPDGSQRVDIDPIYDYPRLALRVQSADNILARKAAKYVAEYSGGVLRDESK